MAELLGKVVIVTGASSGIGEATALRLAEMGAKLALVARRKDRLDKLAKQVEATGSEVLVIEADVTDKTKAPTIIKKVVDKWGGVDILINNAGVMLLGPVADASLEEWETMVHVNVLGLLYLTHAAVPHMKKTGTGHIVNVSSVAGRTSRSGSAVYNATKWGVVGFTDALRQEFAEAKLNVRTTLIEPGAVATELQGHNRPEIQAEFKKRFAGIEMLQSVDIAAAIAYAVSQPPHVSVNEILIRPTLQVG